MQDRHGAMGMQFASRPARCIIACAAAIVCLLASSIADAADPWLLPTTTDSEASLLVSESARSRRLPPIVPREPQADSILLAGAERGGPLLPFAGQQVSYVAASPRGAASALNPSTPAGVGQPLFKFSALQDPDAPDAEKQNAEAAGEGQSGEQQTYGQAPTNNSLQFLRDVDVLLKPGAWQADTGFVYTHFANSFPLAVVDPMGTVVDVAQANVRRRLIFSPLAARYGLTDNVQLFGFLPAGFSDTQISSVGASQTMNVSGLGDLTAGASIHLIKGEDEFPDVIGTVGFTAPTGKFSSPIFGLVPGSNLGQGFWAYSAQLLFINRADPLIVFYGGGYRHLWERPFDGGVLYRPGEQVNYMFGVGFAVNDRVTLSSTFQGFYITNTFINGENVRGSNLEPMSMRFAATIVRNCRIIEPFVQIGATASAPRANFGVIITFY